MDFYYGEGCQTGHYWSDRGNGGICNFCGEKLRCDFCGAFMRVDGIDAHLAKCRVLSKLPVEEGE